MKPAKFKHPITIKWGMGSQNERRYALKWKRTIITKDEAEYLMDQAERKRRQERAIKDDQTHDTD